MRRIAPLFLPLSVLILPGCIAKTALGVVTAPIKVAGKAADIATTSQAESDEKRGREMRKREEKLGKLYRQRAKLIQKCHHGKHSACRDLAAVEAQINEMEPAFPVEGDGP